MSTPVNMSLVTVRGRFIRLDGSPMSGSISFSPSVQVIINQGAEVIISGAVFTSPLDATGYFEIAIPATDDPDLSPTNFTYTVNEPTGRVYAISVPEATPGQVLDLIDVVPVPNSPGNTTILLSGRGLASVTVDVDGDLSVQYDDGSDPVLIGNILGPVGPVGPAGPQGVPGPQGVQGPTGPSGPILQSADYDNSVAPVTGQVIAWDGTLYGPEYVSGLVDHGGVTGLADDDHTQYHNDARGDVRYYPRADVDTALAGKAATSDPRFTDARTPTAHATSHASGGSDDISASYVAVSRISAASGVAGLDSSTKLKSAEIPFGAGAGTVAQGNDSRFTDARTPTAHKTSHATGGSDVLTPADIGAASTSHAASHATGGADELTPAAIGAATSGHTHGGVTPAAHAASHAPGGSDTLTGSYVDLANAQTVAGIKTFSDAPVVPVGSVSGNPVRRDDSRLTDARTPTAHKTSHATGGSDVLTPADIAALATSARGAASGVASLDASTKVPYAQLPVGTAASTVAAGNDSRFTDPPSGTAGGSLAGSYPNPTIAAGVITGTEIAAAVKDPVAATAGLRTLGTGAQQAAAGNDARLSDARTPTAHKTSHATGGSDVLTPADIGAATSAHAHAGADITSGTVAAARLPLVPGVITSQSSGAATITLDASLGNNRNITATGALTLNAPTNPTDHQLLQISVLASGGSRVISLGAGIVLLEGITFPVTVTSTKILRIALRYSTLLTAWVVEAAAVTV